MKRMKLKRFLVLLLLIIVTVVSSGSKGAYTNNTTQQVNPDSLPTLATLDTGNAQCQELIADSQFCIAYDAKGELKENLVAEVEHYIYKLAPSAHHSIPEHLVTRALEENIDICFMMAQSEIETAYGTAGAGRPTSRRSMFGVSKRKYQSYQLAIDDYIDILQKNYLGHGKTEQHLMKKYVTHGGYRYAESTSYEAKLSKTYNKICGSTNIRTLQKQYQVM